MDCLCSTSFCVESPSKQLARDNFVEFGFLVLAAPFSTKLSQRWRIRHTRLVEYCCTGMGGLRSPAQARAPDGDSKKQCCAWDGRPLSAEFTGTGPAGEVAAWIAMALPTVSQISRGGGRSHFRVRRRSTLRTQGPLTPLVPAAVIALKPGQVQAAGIWLGGECSASLGGGSIRSTAQPPAPGPTVGGGDLMLARRVSPCSPGLSILAGAW